ncbi:TPA: hypothetical protein U2I64_002543 [Providencia stuartii]|nr:hypothetical protein [Providencia stuartii]
MALHPVSKHERTSKMLQCLPTLHPPDNAGKSTDEKTLSVFRQIYFVTNNK